MRAEIDADGHHLTGHLTDDRQHSQRGQCGRQGVTRWTRAEIEAVLGGPLMVPDPMLTAVQAARLLGVAVSRIDRLVAAGGLPQHGRPGRRRLFRLSELDQVDAAAPAPQPPASVRRRFGFESGPPRPPSAEPRLSMREAARIVGMGETTLRRYYFGTPDLPRLPGSHYVVAAHDADELARLYANRLTVAEAAARVGGSQEEIRRLLRDGRLPRIPDRQRPVRVDHLEQLIATGWLFGDPAHRDRIPTSQAARRLGLSKNTILARARTGLLPAVRDRRGHWWFRPEHLDIIYRARISEERGQLVAVQS
jgi:excisionase family DNA binding protein